MTDTTATTTTTHDAPQMPPGWESEADTLVVLTDPSGAARAWFAPALGGNTLAFAVRTGGGEWVQVLAYADPATVRAQPTRYGSAVLFPFPGHTRGGTYQWGGVTYTLPGPLSSGGTITHGFAQKHPWHIAETTASSVTARFETPADLAPDEREAYPFAVTVTETVHLAGNALYISLEATNNDAKNVPIGIALHPYFAVAALGGTRDGVQVSLAGATERVLSPPIPTEETRPAPGDFTAVPVGTVDTRSRTAIDAGADATLTGATGRVRFTHVEGAHDLLYFAPPWQESLSLEPHSLMPSAASYPEGHSNGLPAIAPGETVRLAIRVAFEALQ